jgi:DNA helicase-2/ATP-dependent DNA helicase PcrA
MEDLLAKLNGPQREAALYEGKTLLIVAGAGSGKTRVLTNRIANILYNGYCYSSQILAITFTNKAASEMKERLSQMLSNEVVWPMWVSTFHAACVRILRKWHEKLRLKSSFTIYDTDDSRRLIKNILDEEGIDIKKYPPKLFQAAISDYKNNLVSVGKAEQLASESGEIKEEINARIYRKYQERLSNLFALDFDDLIGKTIHLLEKDAEVRQFYNQKFRYIFVDEYQDTNTAQYKLIRLLAGYDAPIGQEVSELGAVPKANITVVGDSDQSIYAFRGATIRNIIEFEQDFPDAKVVLLEQNYRSTNNILKAANAVIDQNSDRKKKNLWSDNGEGEKVYFHKAYNGYEEAEYIVSQIRYLEREEGARYGDMAIFYRANSLSRSIEEKLVDAGLGAYYKMVGGTKFYDRKEIRDVLAYLYAIINRDDDIHLRRILNVPARGIGKKSEEHVAAFAADYGCSFATIFSMIDEVEDLSNAAMRKITDFNKVLDQLLEYIEGDEEPTLEQILNKTLELTGYLADLEKSEDPQDQVRVDNVQELVAAAATFEPTQEIDDEQLINADQGAGLTKEQIDELNKVEYSPRELLEKFLEQIALSSDSDQIPENQLHDLGQITLMTLHTAKGLEFDNVFLMGFEEGHLPHANSVNDEFELSEERRLAYVGITRARKRLYLTMAQVRNVFGKWLDFAPSRFLADIPPELLEECE